jgi:hypothetical protein
MKRHAHCRARASRRSTTKARVLSVTEARSGQSPTAHRGPHGASGSIAEQGSRRNAWSAPSRAPLAIVEQSPDGARTWESAA